MKLIRALCLILGCLLGTVFAYRPPAKAQELQAPLTAVNEQFMVTAERDLDHCEAQVNDFLAEEPKQAQKKDPCAPCKTGSFVSSCDVTITCQNAPGNSLSYGNLSCTVMCELGNLQSSVPTPDCNVLCQKTCGGRRKDCTCKVAQYF